VAQIEVTVTTPQGVELKTQADELTLPSVEGEFGVLPGHLPLLAGLKTGLVRIHNRGEITPFAVGPGFVQVTEGRASILSLRFLRKADVDPIVCRKELKEAETELTALGGEGGSYESTTTREALRAAIAKARWAAVCLELYGDTPPPTLIFEPETQLLGYEDFLGRLRSEAAQASTDGGGEAHT
jgi:F-type H+-transporting ATPase subunit epsilon